MERHLSWNEDDPNNTNDYKSKKNNNPWDRNKPKSKQDNNDGLPDLDEMLKKSQQWLKQVLNGNNKRGGFNGGGSSGINNAGGPFIIIAAVIFIFIIGIMGFYKVEPGEQAVEYRFGKYIGTQGSGPHWLLPGVYSKEILNTSVVYQREFEDDLITKEVDIVSVKLAVQYKIEDIEKFLFKVASPEDSLAEATKAAIRQIIAESTLEEVLSTRGSSKDAYMGNQIRRLIVDNLKLYQSGLDVQGVEVLAVMPPQEVKEAFNDAIQAQEDEIRYQNEADAYERKVVPIAQGQAARVTQEAKAYAAQTVLAAQGDVARFKSILPEYQSAPDVTRNRLYINTMEKALQNTPKILVDTKSNNVLFLPMDKLNFNSMMTGKNTKSLPNSPTVDESISSNILNNNKNMADAVENKATRISTNDTRGVRSWRE